MVKSYSSKLIIILFSCFSFSAFGQLSGTKTIPGDYATIAQAVDSLNAQGVAAPGVTFDVAADHTETGVISVITATGTSAAPIVFQKSGVGANPIVIAGTGTAALDGIIRLSGTDYITFDAIDLQENPTNTTTTTQMEWGYALLKASATDGSQNVTIKNSNITLNKANTASVGIYSANHTAASITNLTITNVAGANSNNKLFGNTISNVYVGIRLAGSSLTSYYDVNNEIGVGAGNLITDFSGGAATGYGIYTIYQDNLKVSNNTINGGNGTTLNLYGIYVGTATSANTEITYNTVTVHSSATSSTYDLFGIYNISGSTAAANTVTISNNTVVNSTFSTATAASYFIGIQNAGSAAVVNLNDNTVSNFTYPGTGIIYGIYNSAAVAANTLNITGNTVSDLTRTGSVAGTMYGINATTALITVNNNNIFNLNNGTGILYGYSNTGSPTQEVYTNNRIYNLTGAGTIYGLNANSTASGNRTATLNQIYALTTSGTTIYGMYAGSAPATYSRNKITDLTSNSLTTATVNGVHIISGNNIWNNNLIANLSAPSATGFTAVNGIQVTGGTAHELNYNTIYLNASSSASGDFGSNGVYVSSTTANVTLRNNIVVNKSTPKGVGRTVALRVPNTSQIGSASNHNLYYAGTPSAVNVIYFDGTTYDETLAQYKARVSPKEKRSVTEDPNFLSTVSSSPDFLRPNPSVPTKIESGAIEIAGITDDYYTVGIRTGYPKAGQVNGGGFKPDIGGVEGDYTIFPVIDVGITALTAPVLPKCTGATETVTFTLSNLATSPIDFSVNEVTIESFAVNPAGDTTIFTTVVRNSGTLAGSSSEPITVSVTYDMSSPGIYMFHAWATTADDNDNTNDTLVPRTINIRPGTVTASKPDICAGDDIVLTLTGHSGTIQWQSSTDSVTFANETGTGNTSASYTVTPMTSTWYRAVVCGNMISDTVFVDVTFVPAPTASNVTRCGEGNVTITASSSYPVTWYDAPVGGNKVDTGLVITPYVTGPTSFYAEATSGGAGVETGGKPAPTLTTGTTGPAWGLVFDVTRDMTLESVNIYSVGASAGTMSVELRDNAGALITTAGPFAYPAGSTANPSIVTLPLNFDIPVGTGYRMVSAAMSGGDVIREQSGNTYPYVSSKGTVSITSGFITNPGSASYYWFYDWKISSGCASERTPVFVSVTAAPPIFAATSDTLICEGDSVTLSVTSTNNDYTYTWSPSNGLGSATGDSVNAAPDTTMYYFVNAIDPSGCEALDSVEVAVNPFAAVTATATDSSICRGNTVQLNVIDSSLNYVQVGNGTVTNTTITYPAPYGNYYWGAKHQMLIRASELIAAGMIPGPISSLAFDVVSINNSPALEDFTIKIGHTAQTAMTTTFATGSLTTVFYQASYMPVNGENTHNFSSPFTWDGVSNIIVETCFNNSDYENNATFMQTNTGFNATLYERDDELNVCDTTTGTTSQNRPNMVFGQKFQMAYSWTPSTGLSNDTILNPFAAPDSTTTYQVTVTHPVTGCTRTSSVTITVDPAPDVTFSISAISCNNSNDAAISFTQNSGTPVTFVWAHDPTETSDSLSGLAAGNYVLTVTNPDNGCSIVLDTTFVNPDTLGLTVNNTDATCFGIANGNASVNVTGGTPSYTYSWNTSPVQTSVTATNLGAGTYEVLVTDANGCTKTASSTINEPTEIVINSNVTNIACFGSGSGSIIAASSGGTGTYTYSWSHDASNLSPFADSLSAGSYTLTVSDANSCTKSEVFQVTEPTQITGTVSVINETCKDLDNGQASVAVTGGSGFYNITWNTSPAQTGTTASNLAPGVYDVVITDSEGCSITKTATITEGADMPVAGFNYTAVTGNQFSFTSTSTGETSWSWNFGDGTVSSLENPVHTYAEPGNYTVTLMVSNNCGSHFIQKQILSTSIVEASLISELEVFPNPTANSFTVKFTGLDIGNIAVRLMNHTGQVIMDDNRSNFAGSYNQKFDLSNYASGMYTLQIISDKGAITRKIVLTR